MKLLASIQKSGYRTASKTSFSTGFTLIEILVVIAIIGILTAIIMPSLSTARAKGRDAQRVSDIKQIQLALELYYDACGNYPYDIYDTNNNVCGSVSSGVGLVASGYIPNVPYDPLSSSPCTSDTSGNSGCYEYVSLCLNGSSVPNSYHLGATLETGNSALQNDADASKNSSVCTNSAYGSDFSGLSDISAGHPCSGLAANIGNAYPASSNQETCFDVKP